MKPDKFIDKLNITKKGFIFLTIAISLLMLNGKAFSSDTNGLYPLTFVNDKVNDTLLEPLKRLKNVIDLINLKYHEALSNEIEAQVSRKDFKWVFEADGISPVKPVVNQEDGTVIVATTGLDLEFKLRNLRNDENLFRIGNLQSKLYALKPDPISKRGRKKWVEDIDGVIIFPPVLSNGDTFVMSIEVDVNLKDLEGLEGLEGLDNLEGFLENLEDLVNLGNNILNDIGGKLTAVNKNGQKTWNAPVEFDRALPIGLPVAAAGLILATTIKIPDFSEISSNISDIVKDFTGIVSAFNSETGEEEWTFNPAELGNGTPLIVITPPTFNDDMIFVNAISPISVEEITTLIDTVVNNLSEDVIPLISDSLPELLGIITVGGDTEPLLNDIENNIEPLIDDTVNKVIDELLDLGRIFALDLEGNVKWESRFPGISLTSPCVTGAGINVSSANILLDDVSSDIDIKVTQTPDGGLLVNVTANFLIAGASINVGIELMVDINDLSNIPEPKIDIPKIEDIVKDIKIDLGGVLTAFNTSNGERLWKTEINEAIFVKPVVSGNQIIASASGFNITSEADSFAISSPISKIYSLGTANGEINWESDRFEGTIVSSVLLGPDNGVFFAFLDKGNLQVQALDPDDGSTKWANPFKADNFVTSAPIINPNDGMVFLATSKIKDLLDFIPTGIRDIIPDLKGEIIGLDPSTGSVAKTIEVDGFALTSPAIDKNSDTIYSVTSDFTIRFLRSPVRLVLSTIVYASDLNLN